MIRAAVLTREQFVGWLGRAFQPASREMTADELADLKPESVALAWRHSSQSDLEGRVPPIIAVRSTEMREFFSFVGTYVSTYQPFSAFFRVVPLDLIAELVDKEHGGPRNVVSEHLMGPIIAEAHAQIAERSRTLSDLSIQGCLATLSSSAVATLASGYNRRHLGLAFDKWLKTRQRLTNEELRLSPSLVREFWNVISLLYENHPRGQESIDEPAQNILPFLTDVMSLTDDTDPQTWPLLTEALPLARLGLRQMRESRESRVRALDKVIPEIASTENVDRRVREVIAAYLASRVAAGSLRYLELLRSVASQLPAATLWFGFFASLHTDSDVMTAGGCLGRRLSRHFGRVETVFDVPSTDVSADEFEVLVPDRKSDLKFRTEHQGIIAVEIFPGVKGLFRLPRDPPKDREDRPANIASEAAREIKYLVDRLGRVVEELYDPRQGTLFSSDLPRDRNSPRPRKKDK
jgi:hypothetical protein